MVKRILSTVLALVTALSCMPAYAYEYRAPLGEGESIEDKNAKYLLDEQSATSAITSTHNLIAPSGWDIDRRGGSFANIRTAHFVVKDTSDKYPVSGSFNFDKQTTGKFTFEAYFNFNNLEDGFFVEFSEKNGDAPVRLFTQNGYWCADKNGDTAYLVKCEETEEQRIRMIIDMDKKSFMFALNGKVISEDLKFTCEVASLDILKISTSPENECDMIWGPLAIHKNYLIADRFLTSPVGTVPYSWKVESLNEGGVSVEDAKKTGVADVNALRINDTSSADRITVTNSFDKCSEKTIVDFIVLMQEYPQNVTFALKSGEQDVVKLKTKDKALYSGNTLLKEYTNKNWNKIRIEADPALQTADIKINGKLKATVPFENKADFFDSFEVSTSVQGKSEFWIDSVYVYPEYEYDDYPQLDEADLVGKDDGYTIGMHQCNLWYNGHGRGWDVLSTYDEQVPYLGFYDEGKPELADWELKYMLEHGIDFIIPCYYSPGNYKSGPMQPEGGVDRALIDGFMNSKYSKYMKFALNYCSTRGETIDDFIEYGLDFLCEYFYSDERYMTVDNKPLIFYWVPQDLKTQFGGTEGAKRATDAMREACIELGYDGAYIIAGCNFAEDVQLKSYQDYGFDYGFLYSVSGTGGYNILNQQSFLNDYMGDKGKLLDTIGTMSVGTNSRAWISDATNNPWVSKEDYKTQLEWLKNEYMPTFSEDSLASNMIMIDNWNEISEGHAVTPSKLFGFSCLDSIREVFCGNSEEHADEIPNEKQAERLRGTYPKDRKTLRYIRPIGNADIPTKVGHSWNFASQEDAAEWQITKQVENFRQEDGVIKGTAVDADGGMQTKEPLNINIDMVTYVKVRVKSSGTENGHEMNGNTAEIFFTTAENPNWTQKQSSQTMLVDADFVDLYFPIYKNLLWKGTLTGLRFDPFVGKGEFEVESIEFLETEIKKATLSIDGEDFAFVKTPVNVNGTMFVGVDTVYDFWSKLDLFLQYDHGTKEIKFIGDNKTLIFREGSSVATVNGEEIQLADKVFYEDGLMMVPIRTVAEVFDIKVSWNQEKYAITLEKPKAAVVVQETEPVIRIPFEWEFSVDKDTEGWTTNGGVAKSKVKDGVWQMRSSSNDPIVWMQNIEMPAKQYKTMIISIKNETTANIAQLFFTTKSSTGYDTQKCYNINMETQSEEFVEYELDLTTNSLWDGTITNLRFDPVSTKGSYEIDYIRFTE
ncbi:MAG: hypothetical protein J6C82_05960 [Clostridia bacterium]|nr:hypothetical protein [Clostridia bacterium]